MDSLEELDSRTMERLGKQGGFLLSTYHAELAKDPASRATESSRSNVIALWHTIKQIYGKAVARIFFFSPEIADNHRIDSLMGSAYRQR